MPRSPHANARSSRAHVHARTCFEPAADGDGVMQAGSIAQERLCLFITAAWRSSACCMHSHTCPRANVGLSLLSPPPQPSITGGCSREHPCARSHTARATCRSWPCTNSKQQSKKTAARCSGFWQPSQKLPLCHAGVPAKGGAGRADLPGGSIPFPSFNPVACGSS